MLEKLKKEHKTFVRAFWLSWAIYFAIFLVSCFYYYSFLHNK